jgi:hypothetical protein
LLAAGVVGAPACAKAGCGRNPSGASSDDTTSALARTTLTVRCTLGLLIFITNSKLSVAHRPH